MKMERNIDFGKVTFEGREYQLTEQAQADNFGTQGEVRYYANAIDEFGDRYRVVWETIDFIFEGEDEEDACDWEHPIDVEELD